MLGWIFLPSVMYLATVLASVVAGFTGAGAALTIFYLPVLAQSLPGFIAMTFLGKPSDESAGIVAAVLLNAVFLGIIGAVAGRLDSTLKRRAVFVSMDLALILTALVYVNVYPTAGIFSIFVLSSRTPQAQAERLVELLENPDPTAQAEFKRKYQALNQWGKSDVVTVCMEKCDEQTTMQLFGEFVGGKSRNRDNVLYSVRRTKDPHLFVPILQRLLQDPDDSVRAQAACQLAGITGRIPDYAETNWTRMVIKDCEFIPSHGAGGTTANSAVRPPQGIQAK